MSRTNVFHRGNSDPCSLAFAALSTSVDMEGVSVGDDGRCLRCGVAGPLVDASTVVSSKFSDWDRQIPTVLVRSGNAGWCWTCAWAYRGKNNRMNRLWISDEGAEIVSVAELGSRLLSPVPSSVCVVAPIAARKHVLPYAVWGAVATDDGVVSWGASEARLTDVMRRMRMAGVRGQELSSDAPPFRVCASADAERIMSMWSTIVSMRGQVPWKIAEWCTRQWKAF